ncbi:hypothetical protein BH10ACI2_BH10ACI2_14500 [soil metagenome]
MKEMCRLRSKPFASTGINIRIVLAFIVLSGLINAQTPSAKYVLDEKQARSLVSKVLVHSPIIDGHSDLYAWYFGYQCKKQAKCPQGTEDYPIDTVTKGQTDIPRWRKGGVGGVLLNAFGADAISPSVLSDFTHHLERVYSKDLKVVTTSADMREAMRSGKIALLPMMEGSERLAGNISDLDSLYKLDLRCMTFTYVTGPFADGSDDEPRNNGISDKGKELGPVDISS